jgi:hypothetical protein
VSLGKYLQRASVSNLGYQANPVLRIPFGSGLATDGLCFFGALGFTNPCVTRGWTDFNGNLNPDCVLSNPNANGECQPIDNLAFGSNQLTNQINSGLLSGWGVRPSDWSFGASVQQQLFPRASVEVGYFHRSFTQYATSGVVTDNLAVSPNDVGTFYLTAPLDPRLPGGGGYRIGPLYDINTSKFGQVSNLVESTKSVGDDTRVFNGVDVTFQLRNLQGVTFTGGTSTGKVEDDFCAVRAVVPEAYLLNAYCHNISPWQTSFRGLVSYTIPRIDVNLSSVWQDKPNIGTDQIASLTANYTPTAADLASAQAQLGRPLNNPAPQVNLLAPGQLYGPRIREIDFSAKKYIPIHGPRLMVGVDIYNLTNNNVTLGFNQTFVATAPGATPAASWPGTTSYMNPRVFRLAAEVSW